MLPETKVWLSGVKATDQIRPVWPRNMTGGFLKLATSHSLMVASRALDASHRPSGENATQSTGPACQPTRICCPSARFHNRTVRSIEAEASCLPSGEKQTQ